MSVTRQEDFEKALADIPNNELIDMVSKEVSKLAKTYGKSFTMGVPPRVTDTDMIITELVSRYKGLTSGAENLLNNLTHRDVYSYHDDMMINALLAKFNLKRDEEASS